MSGEQQRATTANEQQQSVVAHLLNLANKLIALVHHAQAMRAACALVCVLSRTTATTATTATTTNNTNTNSAKLHAAAAGAGIAINRTVAQAELMAALELLLIGYCAVLKMRVISSLCERN